MNHTTKKKKENKNAVKKVKEKDIKEMLQIIKIKWKANEKFKWLSLKNDDTVHLKDIQLNFLNLLKKTLLKLLYISFRLWNA